MENISQHSGFMTMKMLNHCKRMFNDGLVMTALEIE